MDIKSTENVIDITKSDYIIDVSVNDYVVEITAVEPDIGASSSDTVIDITSRDYIIDVIAEQNNIIFELNSTGPQGPPGDSGGGGPWTYVQESTPTGGEGYTWFQPSTEYGHIWRNSMWDKITMDKRLESDTESILLNGGHF